MLAEAQAVSWRGLVSRRIECRLSMHDCDSVASDARAAIFRGMEEGANESNDCQVKRGENHHDACASSEGHGP
jgi:hypothetical protein